MAFICLLDLEAKISVSVLSVVPGPYMWNNGNNNGNANIVKFHDFKQIWRKFESVSTNYIVQLLELVDLFFHLTLMALMTSWQS